MKFTVKVGKEFDVENVDVVEQKDESTKLQHFLASFRAQVALIVFAIAFLFLVGASIVGAFRGDFSALEAVWKVTAMPVGMVLAHYFQNK